MKEGIGLALDKENNRAFVTDMGGNIHQFSLDGMQRKLLYSGNDGQGFTGIAYVAEGLIIRLSPQPPLDKYQAFF